MIRIPTGTCRSLYVHLKMNAASQSLVHGTGGGTQQALMVNMYISGIKIHQAIQHAEDPDAVGHMFAASCM